MSLPIGIRTYLMTRALGALGRTPGRLASGIFGAADGGMMTGAIITCKLLSSTFFAMDTMAFQAVVGTLCIDSSSYSITCPVPLPVSLSVRLVIAEASYSIMDSRCLRCANSTSLGVLSAPNPRTYLLTSP